MQSDFWYGWDSLRRCKVGTFTVVAATPEPSSLIMLCGGLLFVALLLCRSATQKQIAPLSGKCTAKRLT